MSSLESSQCLHYSQINVFTRVKSIFLVESSQCPHYSEVNDFNRFKSKSFIDGQINLFTKVKSMFSPEPQRFKLLL